MSEAPTWNNPLKEQLPNSLPPIYISLGRHGPGDAEFLTDYKDQLESLLKENSEGKLVVGLELAGVPLEVCQAIEESFSENGTLLSPYVFAAFSLGKGRAPTPADLETYRKKLRERKLFRYTELRLLEDLGRRYKGRVEAFFEGSSSKDILSDVRGRVKGPIGSALARIKDEEEGQKVDVEMLAQSLVKEAYNRLKNQEPDIALALFKGVVELVAYSSEVRERRLIERIKQVATQKGVFAIAIRFGEAHTSIVHALRREGYEVYRIRAGKKESGYLLYPYSVALARSLLLRPEYQIPETEWLKGLISDMLINMVLSGMKVSSSERGHQKVSNMVNKAVRNKLSTPEQVSDFREAVKEKGLGPALEITFGQQIREFLSP